MADFQDAPPTRPLPPGPPATLPLLPTPGAPPPPTTRPLPPPAATRVLPEQPTPATLPDPADLRPAGPARRWTWLLGGLAAGAGAVALALSLLAHLTDPAPSAAASAAPSTATSAVGGSSSPAPTAPSTAPALYTELADGCALLRPETVERYAKGATCTASPAVGGTVSARGTWTGGSGYATVEVGVLLSPQAGSVYQQTVTIDRTSASGAGGKITGDRTVPGLGDRATVLHVAYGNFGRVTLTALRGNALVTVGYSAAAGSGPSAEGAPDPAEAAAVAFAQDALGTLTAP
ncbi:hypothetical protein [Kitasatospora sp. NPDC004272]